MIETGISFLLNLLVNAIGAFIGFWLALYLQHRNNINKKQDNISKVIINVKDEISDILPTLKKYSEENKPLVFSILTPNWDSLLASGIAIDFFITSPIYNQVIKVYSLIKHFNNMRLILSDEQNLDEIKKIIEAMEKIL